MKAVHLDGLTMDSMAATGDFAMKQGEGIKTGKVTNKYVDPNRFGKIKVGKGDGDGYGSGTGKGNKTVKAPPKKTCKPVKAKPIKQVKVPPSAYPPAAKRRGIEGTMVALLSVDDKGNVTKVKVVKPLGYGFDELSRVSNTVKAFDQELDKFVLNQNPH